MFRSYSLARRLIVLLVVLMAGGFAGFVYLSLSTHERQLMSQIRASGERATDLIVRSADYAMLHNQRDILTRMIRDVGGEPGIEVARIYNKRGVISMSSQQAEEGQIVDMQAEACNVCHAQGTTVRQLSEHDRSRIVDRAGVRSLGVIRPIYNRADCSGPPCHAHSIDQSVLGLLEVRMSIGGVDAALARGVRQEIAMGLAMVLVVSVFAGFFVHRVVQRPVVRLAQGTREIAAGNLEVQLPVAGAKELAALAEDFNQMARSLEAAHETNLKWSETLERRVNEKTEELQRLHQRILQVEKMASLGQLAATVAHELNNPLSGILTYAKLIRRKVQKESSTEPEELKFIIDQTQRCGQIVKNLLLFARQGIGEVASHNFVELAEESLRVVEHHLAIHNVSLHKDLELATAVCDGAQVRQALVALLVNAIEAMPDGGDLTIRVHPHARRGGVLVTLIDTGMGINPEDLPHIFEPFYTSKPEGQGVGLGLAVVYGIVSRHGGEIQVDSSPGSGTTFVVHFPATPQAKAPEEKQTHA
jgi:two-component system NtrC family sensor kinase